MSLEPKAGLVLRYDFLWKEEERKGLEHGLKDRPCAVAIVSQPNEDDSRTVILCAITHSPPRDNENAVEIPLKVARHLNLDYDRMWIKTQQVNKLQWSEERIPYGFIKTPKNDWSYGVLPYALRQQVLQKIRENKRNVQIINRG